MVQTTVKTENGRPTEVLEQFVDSADKRTDRARVVLKVKNGVCYPEKKVSFDYVERSNFDIGLCRDLAAFLEANPEAKACNCGNEKTNKAIAKILSKYGNVVAERPAGGPYAERTQAQLSAVWKQIAGLLEQPMSQAYEQLDKCVEIPGLASAAGDKHIWGNSAVRVPGASDESGEGQQGSEYSAH